MYSEMDIVLEHLFSKSLEERHQDFDEKENMIKVQIVARGYHTTAKTGDIRHAVGDTMDYAAALLGSGEVKYRERAWACIHRILELQDIEEKNHTYGIWPYTLEEPLKAMSDPDWNMADFTSKKLLGVIIDYSSSLPEELLERVKTAVYHASKSIMRRNMGPDYTNINLMGAYVTISAGETLLNDEFFRYGKRRLQKELDFVKINGGFSEYNSPSYSILAIEEIGRMLKYIHDRECLEIAEELNDMAWRSVAQHFHYPTRQLSAPHSRCYENISGTKFLSFLHIGTRMSLDLMDARDIYFDLLWKQLIIKCPEKYYSCFKPIDKPRYLQEQFYKGHDTISEDEIRVYIEKNAFAMEARTYMNKNFSLGSFTLSDFWNQRRPLMAYWGNVGKPAFMRLRVLKDGKDFCSAMLSAFQLANHIAGGVYFVKDHGDYHFVLDLLKDGQTEACELTVRFEVGGYMEDVTIPSDIRVGKYFDITAGDILIRINPALCVFDDNTIKVRTGMDASAKWVDFVLYEGEKKLLDFNRITKAAFVFGLSVFDKEYCGGDDRVIYSCKVNPEENTISEEVSFGGEQGSITIPAKPSVYIENPAPGMVRKVKCGGFIYEKME